MRLRLLPFSLALCFAALPGQAASPPEKPAQAVLQGCSWDWKQGAGIGFWSQHCDLETGKWRIEFDAGGKRFLQTVDGKDGHPVIHVFEKAAGADISVLLPELRKAGLIKDTGDCVFAPDEDNAAEGGRST